MNAPRRGPLAAGLVAALVVVGAVVALTAGTSGGVPGTGPSPTVDVAGTREAAPGTPGAAQTPAGTPGGSAEEAVGPILDLVTELESGGAVSDPAAPGAAVEVAPGVQVTLVEAVPVDGRAAGPGESSGPALALTVEVANATGAPVSTDGLVVNLYGAEGVPGSQLLGDPRSEPLHGDVAPGDTGRGVHVLTRPGGDAVGPHVVSISLGVGLTTALVLVPPEAG